MSNGINVWYDLMTKDMEGAIAFYTETIGWKTQQWPDADPNMPYTMWAVGEAPVGGTMTLPKEAADMGAPSHWLAYTTVEDVDATVTKAKELGAQVYREPWSMPKVGRMAVLADPQGAVFAVFTPENDMPPTERNAVGEFSWAELNTTDFDAAWKFYSELFDWEHRDTMDMGPQGQYFMWKHKSAITKGGMSNMAKAMNIPPHWLHYINVDDIDAAVTRIKDKGGQVNMGPMEIPGNDKIAICQDPQGAAFAIYMEGKRD